MKSQTFGERIKEKRLKLNYSLKYVSSLIDYNPTSLGKVEKNQLIAPKRIIAPLAAVLNFEYKDFMLKYLSQKVYYEIKEYNFAEEVLDIVHKRLNKEGQGTQYLKERGELLNIINLCFSNKPIEKAWLFGSFARNTESYDSDIDILIEFEKPNKISLFDLIDIKRELTEKTGREIDLVEKGSELESMRAQIQNEKLLVYEKQTNRLGANPTHD